MILQKELVLPAYKRGFHIITSTIVNALGNLPEVGILNIFLHHTSAGLCINENADSTVLADMETAFNRLAPERLPEYKHTMEGDDDMPAHVKSALTGVSLCIPIANGRLKLGTWQGIYLCEYRNHGGNRRLTLTVIY